MTNDRIQMTKELAAEAMKQRVRERQEKKSRGGAEGRQRKDEGWLSSGGRSIWLASQGASDSQQPADTGCGHWGSDARNEALAPRSQTKFPLIVETRNGAEMMSVTMPPSSRPMKATLKMMSSAIACAADAPDACRAASSTILGSPTCVPRSGSTSSAIRAAS